MGAPSHLLPFIIILLELSSHCSICILTASSFLNIIILGSSSQCSIFLLISSSIEGIILGLASQCSNPYLSSSSSSSLSYLGCHHNPPTPTYLLLLHLHLLHHTWVVIIMIETLFVSSFITDVDIVIIIKTWVSSQFLNPTPSPQSSVWDECKACGEKHAEKFPSIFGRHLNTQGYYS